MLYITCTNTTSSTSSTSSLSSSASVNTSMSRSPTLSQQPPNLQPQDVGESSSSPSSPSQVSQHPIIAPISASLDSPFQPPSPPKLSCSLSHESTPSSSSPPPQLSICAVLNRMAATKTPTTIDTTSTTTTFTTTTATSNASFTSNHCSIRQTHSEPQPQQQHPQQRHHNTRSTGRKRPSQGKEHVESRSSRAALKSMYFGGKKTNPVWTCFEDLRIRGLSGVRCRYCLWITNDRSPTTLKFHLKRKHDTGFGGIWFNIEEKIHLSPSNVRLMRVKDVLGNNKIATLNGGANDTSSTSFFPGARAVIEATPSSSQQQALDQLLQNVTSSTVHDNSSNAKLNDNGVMTSVAPSAEEPAYMISDSENVGQLFQIASEMNFAVTYNLQSRHEYCFESNSSKAKGKVVAFFDSGNRVGVVERTNGIDTGFEEWYKADWCQFLWAVRGKCTSALN